VTVPKVFIKVSHVRAASVLRIEEYKQTQWRKI
jgi:hypothetical protein